MIERLLEQVKLCDNCGRTMLHFCPCLLEKARKEEAEAAKTATREVSKLDTSYALTIGTGQSLYACPICGTYSIHRAGSKNYCEECGAELGLSSFQARSA